MSDALLTQSHNARVLLPVIHLPHDGRLGMAAVSVALESGADGVFLMNQGTSTDNIVRNLIPALRREFGSGLWIGVNPLGMPVEEFLVDIVCTSGRGTGVASELPKVRTMREAIPGVPMALASGITPENIDAYLPYVEAYLVATGIEEDFGVLDPARTKELADKIHG